MADVIKCGVGGCEMPANVDLSGWPHHKETLHNALHVAPCSYCDGDHRHDNCEAQKANAALLDRLFGVSPKNPEEK